MDVNEKIIFTWLVHHNYFVMDNIFFGQFHKDIDLLAVNLAERKILDLEVKVRTGGIKIADNDNTQNGYQHFVGQLNSVERNAKIDEIIGDLGGFTIHKIFITTQSLLGKVKRQYWIDRFKSDGIEVWFIEDLVSDLEYLARDLPLSRNEVIQILRLQNIKNRTTQPS